MSRALGPQSPKQAWADVTSSTFTPSPACSRIQARSCWPNAVPVTIRNRVSPSLVTVKSHSIPPRGVEHRGVGDGADVPGDAVRAEPLEQVRRALSGDLDLGERRLVEERGGLAAGEVLGADRRRPEAARPAARPERLVAAGGVRLEPVGPLPARLLPEGGAELGQPWVGGREAQRPPGRAARGPGTSRRSRSRRPRPCARACSRASGTRGRSGASPCARRRVTACPRRSTRRRAARSRPRRRGRGRRSPRRSRARTSVGPSMNSPSGVNASGPLISLTTSTSSSDGTRTIAFCISSSKRGQSSARSLPLKSGGIPSSDHGAGLRS